jgi:hypothetical protein
MLLMNGGGSKKTSSLRRPTGLAAQHAIEGARTLYHVLYLFERVWSIEPSVTLQVPHSTRKNIRKVLGNRSMSGSFVAAAEYFQIAALVASKIEVDPSVVKTEKIIRSCGIAANDFQRSLALSSLIRELVRPIHDSASDKQSLKLDQLYVFACDNCLELGRRCDRFSETVLNSQVPFLDVRQMLFSLVELWESFHRFGRVVSVALSNEQVTNEHPIELEKTVNLFGGGLRVG